MKVDVYINEQFGAVTITFPDRQFGGPRLKIECSMLELMQLRAAIDQALKDLA